MKSDERRVSGMQLPFSRRSLIAASVASATTASLQIPGRVAGKEATPSVSDIDNDSLLALSSRIVGGGKLASGAVDGLAALLASEPQIDDTLAELDALAEFRPEALESASPSAQRVAGNILQYWYLGRYDGDPVPNRADIFFGLVSWQALPYATQPTLCKSFGYWAREIEL